MGYYLREIIELRQSFEKAYNEKRYVDAIDEANKMLDLYKENNAVDTEGYADDVNNLAILYDEVNINDKAKELYREAAKLKLELLGEDSASYIDTITNLGILLSTTGDFAEAEELLKTAEKQISQTEGEDSLRYVRSLYNLGNMYGDKGEQEKAIEILSRTLDKAKTVKNFPGDEFEDIHVSIADACRRYGNFRRARDEYAKAIRVSENGEEKDSYFRMTYYLSAAVTHQKCEKYKEAAEIYEKAVAMRERIMDTKHLDFISVLNNLAVIYNKDNRSDKAIEIHERVLSLVEDLLGRNHVFYGDVITNMGVDWYIAGDVDKALKYHNEALDIKRSVVGEKHIHYIWTLISLAEVYEKMEKYDRAMEIQNRALELRREVFGEVNEQICESLVNLGRISIKKCEYENAQGFLMQALIMSKELTLVDGAPVKTNGENIKLLAEVCSKMKETDKAEQFILSLLEYRKGQRSDKHPKYARALYDSAEFLIDMGNFEKACEYLEKACDIAETMVGSDTPFCRQCFHLYGDALYKNGQYDKAADILKKAASLYKKHEPESENLIKIMYMQAECMYIMGYPRKAEEIIFRIDGMASRSENDYSDIMLREKAEYAAVLNMCNEYEMASKVLEEVFEELEKKGKKADSKLLYTCAEALFMSGDYQKSADCALEAEKTAVKTEDKVMASKLAGRCFDKLEKYDMAKELFERAVSHLTENRGTGVNNIGELYCLMADVCAKTGDRLKALEYFDKGFAEIKKHQNMPVDTYRGYLKNASHIAKEAKQYSKAVEYLSENALLIRRDYGENEEFASSLLGAAELYDIQGRYNEAVTMYEKAAEIYKKNNKSKEYTDALYLMLKTMTADKKYAETAEIIEKMTDYCDRRKEFIELLASSYKSMGAIGKLIKLKIGGIS